MELSESDVMCFKRAIALALEAEKCGNLPIGAVISYQGKIVAEGANAIWQPTFNPNRHAEIEALRKVPEALWRHSRELTLYSTLEPCLMCLGAILLHQVGRVLYGSADHYGGASKVAGHMPPYFEEEMAKTKWIGPAYRQECDTLFIRVMKRVEAQSLPGK
jgi:tRNA(adenine34) deaminase